MKARFFRSFFIDLILKLRKSSSDSFLINHFISILYQLSESFNKKISEIYSLRILRNINFRFVLLFLFVISLAIAPESQTQLSSITSTKVNPSQSQFGIVFVSLSNILLIPLLFLFIRQFKKKVSFKIYRFEFFLLLFLVISELSIILGLNSSSSVIWILKMIYSFVIYLIFSRLDLDKKDLTALGSGLLTLVLLEGILALGQFLNGGILGIPILESITKYYEVQGGVNNPIQHGLYFRAIGTLSHSNNLSNFLALLVPFTIILGLEKRIIFKFCTLTSQTGCFSLKRTSLWE